jgi:DNA-directed RNA polymerase subunit RPC12/RpoP
MSTWKEYRNRERLAWAISILGIPAAALLALPVSLPLHSADPFGVTFALFIVAWMVSMVRVELFRCPRCGKRFFMKWYYSNMFARRCLHCGLPLWQEPVEVESGLPGK